MSEVKARPIIFSGAMVQAILDGRKTMTRRVIKPQPAEGYHQWAQVFRGENRAWFTRDTHQGEKGEPYSIECPYGKVGDRLWVRETWRLTEPHAVLNGGELFAYRATSIKAEGVTWKPSIFMPRRACRLLLEITSVKAERVQDISEEDAKAEGAGAWHDGVNGTTYRGEFQLLWDSINAKRGYAWDSNCWVWAVTFKLINQGDGDAAT